MTIHNKLKEARENKHLTQQQVSDTIGITRQAISQWENGKSTPDLETFKALCKLYEISPSSILSEDEKKEEQPQSMNKTISDKEEHLLETIGISLILILMSRFNFIGVITSVVITVWLYKTKRKSVLLYSLCALCFLISLYNSCVVIEHTFPNLRITPSSLLL